MTLPSLGIDYNEVCGRVIGHQVSHPNAFHSPTSFVNDIDTHYVDGVSITHGTNPRKHIWTLANSQYDTYTGDKSSLCPCSTLNSTQEVQDFVGNDYYCESGCFINTASGCTMETMYLGDPLWDGMNCGPAEKGCCSSNQPWFHKVLKSITNDSIELRICADEGSKMEDSPVEFYEIFVKKS